MLKKKNKPEIILRVQREHMFLIDTIYLTLFVLQWESQLTTHNVSRKKLISPSKVTINSSHFSPAQEIDTEYFLYSEYIPSLKNLDDHL